jgi:hypothetical protein
MDIKIWKEDGMLCVKNTSYNYNLKIKTKGDNAEVLPFGGEMGFIINEEFEIEILEEGV